MRTTTPLQKEAPKTAVATAGKATTNPLQQKQPSGQVVQRVSHDKILEIVKDLKITTLGNTKEEIVKTIKEIYGIADELIEQSSEEEMQKLLKDADEKVQEEKNKPLEEEKEVKRKLDENDFRITAGLTEYGLAFGEGFAKDLAKLNEEDRWLDGGAGLGVAIYDHYKKGGKGNTTAVGKVQPAPRNDNEKSVADKLATFDNKFKYLSGSYFSDMPEKEALEKGKTNIISDYNGILSYTKTLSEDLNKYLRLLKVGGRLYTTFGAKIYEGETPIRVLDWLKKDTRDDLEVTFISGSNSFIIEKKREGAAVRTLSFIKQENQGSQMPVREYKIA